MHNRQLAKVSEELGLTRYILLEKDQVSWSDTVLPAVRYDWSVIDQSYH